MITADLRQAIVGAAVAAGCRPGDPGLRPGGAPGRYASSVAFASAGNPLEAAARIARLLSQVPTVASAEVTGPGFITVTVTGAALTAVADQIIQAGPDCVTSDALAGVTVPAPTPGDPLAAATWEEARAALAARVTARLAAAAGATVAEAASTERSLVTLPAHPSSSVPPRPLIGDPPGSPRPAPEAPPHMSGAPRHDICGNFMTRAGRPPSPPAVRRPDADVARAVAFAGRDAVMFTLARAIPGRPLRVDPEVIARHVLGNPAYVVRYAHARAASGVRWAVAYATADAIGAGDTPHARLPGPWPLADPKTGPVVPRAEAAAPGPAVRVVLECVPGPVVPVAGAGVSELVVPHGGADIMTVCAIGPARRDTRGCGVSPPRETTGWYVGVHPRETSVLLDALSWLPERVATAARRGRPDQFARYLEDLASVTIDVLSLASNPGSAAAPGSDRLAMARAARTGLAAGLGLLGVGAPERL